MSNPRPIGVFDSGVGGLTVVKALRDRLQNETILYLGDTARVPYGPKSPETVQRYALELAKMLMQKKFKGAGCGVQHGLISRATSVDEEIFRPCDRSDRAGSASGIAGNP